VNLRAVFGAKPAGFECVVSCPIELLVDLTRANQMLKLLQSGVRAKFKDFLRHVDALEQIQQLSRSRSCVTPALEAGKLGVDLVEANTIAAIVSIAIAKGQVAVRKNVGDDLRGTGRVHPLRRVHPAVG